MHEPATPLRKAPRASVSGRRTWRLADIDYAGADRARAGADPMLFQTVTLASFIETGSDLYAHNLVAYFAGDDVVGRWLAESWEHEEVQHGAALRAYVERVWPDFDWQGTYDAFFDEYAATATVPNLEPARALELAARCVVEMGTATLYGALRSYADEPVLKDLAGHIYADEVRHYKHFYRYFRRYQERERHGRWRVGRTMTRRLLATADDDGRIAYRHLWQATHEGGAGSVDEDYRVFRGRIAAAARRHAPRDLPVEMFLRPLRLPAIAERGARCVAGTLYGWWLDA
ncbi:MAG TPA: ferritin-like domain-containing protein [Casimicrobiaceae bacterium]|nr:ferritin-like domain-containing protein [Casimicrobiaceae bacterium]